MQFNSRDIVVWSSDAPAFVKFLFPRKFILVVPYSGGNGTTSKKGAGAPATSWAATKNESLDWRRTDVPGL